MSSEAELRGRTLWDLLYAARRRLLGVAILVVLYFTSRPLFSSVISLVLLLLVPAIIGTSIGIIYGYYSTKPAYVYVLEVVDHRSLRMLKVSPSALLPTAEGEPFVTRAGHMVRVAKPGTIAVTSSGVSFEPHELHRIALVDPITAYVNVKEIERLTDELERVLETVIRLRAATRAKARYLARRRIAELQKLEDEVLEKLRDELISEDEAGKHG